MQDIWGEYIRSRLIIGALQDRFYHNLDSLMWYTAHF